VLTKQNEIHGISDQCTLLVKLDCVVH